MTSDGFDAPSEEYLRRRFQQMDPDRFEYFVADVWTYLGWETRVVGEPGDKGIDVIATGEHPDGRIEKQLIQAKRYGPNTTVGSPEVQQYAALRLQEDGVDTVTIVTTGTFSRQAEEMAPELDVELVDGAELVDVIDDRDAWPVVAEYVEELVTPEQLDDEPDRDRRDDAGGFVDRVKEWFG
jgi:restriction system protein